jgi:hypothetical protein
MLVVAQHSLHAMSKQRRVDRSGSLTAPFQPCTARRPFLVANISSAHPDTSQKAGFARVYFASFLPGLFGLFVVVQLSNFLRLEIRY